MLEYILNVIQKNFVLSFDLSHFIALSKIMQFMKHPLQLLHFLEKLVFQISSFQTNKKFLVFNNA